LRKSWTFEWNLVSSRVCGTEMFMAGLLGSCGTIIRLASD
jgi:hypothetical protein